MDLTTTNLIEKIKDIQRSSISKSGAHIMLRWQLLGYAIVKHYRQEEFVNIVRMNEKDDWKLWPAIYLHEGKEYHLSVRNIVHIPPVE